MLDDVSDRVHVELNIPTRVCHCSANSTCGSNRGSRYLGDADAVKARADAVATRRKPGAEPARSGQEAAVDDQHLARDVGGGVGREKYDRARESCGSPTRRNGVAPGCIVLELRIVRE